MGRGAVGSGRAGLDADGVRAPDDEALCRDGVCVEALCEREPGFVTVWEEAEGRAAGFAGVGCETVGFGGVGEAGREAVGAAGVAGREGAGREAVGAAGVAGREGAGREAVGAAGVAGREGAGR